mmetsp:Transcript_3636/g.8000  ORF Transcript_3636/g.8000 Transcript_3636/m.8000 type:complete len:247 (+) Transcript_3636:213-953(+)
MTIRVGPIWSFLRSHQEGNAPTYFLDFFFLRLRFFLLLEALEEALEAPSVSAEASSSSPLVLLSASFGEVASSLADEVDSVVAGVLAASFVDESLGVDVSTESFRSASFSAAIVTSSFSSSLGAFASSFALSDRSDFGSSDLRAVSTLLDGFSVVSVDFSETCLITSGSLGAGVSFVGSGEDSFSTDTGLLASLAAEVSVVGLVSSTMGVSLAVVAAAGAGFAAGVAVVDCEEFCCCCWERRAAST